MTGAIVFLVAGLVGVALAGCGRKTASTPPPPARAAPSGGRATELMNAPSSAGDTLLQGAGSMDACSSASSKDPAPPEGCNAVLGIELQKIVE
jgi:hypothetical protein